MKIDFYPKNKTFWRYNIVCWGIVFVALLLQTIVFAQDPLQLTVEIIAGLIFIVLGVHAGFLFRFIFSKKDIQNNRIGSLILIGFTLATTSSIIIGLILGGFGYLSYSQLLPETYDEVRGKYDGLQFLLLIATRNAVTMFFYLTVWHFIYIAVTVHRRTLKAELASLQLKNSLKETQLNSLTGQLNPHFLFNAMNNIRFSIRKNADKAEEMLLNLSDILRYSLDATKHNKTMLIQELDITKRYLALVKLQLRDRLNFNLNVAQESEASLVPPLILQTLVENAIKHGIEQLAEGGSLTVDIRLVDVRVHILIVNDMPLIKSKLTQGSTGLGLENVRTRLKLLYGNDASFTVNKREKLFMAELTLPLERKELRQ
ncbi:sensor histidine kinase [Agaribacter marinus]|uniref:Histidine kinase n=1 Tax=Agaribacter marinus TaxID=1431249 RepID=A0AA37SVX9_9ALTE|nr:histidine kinase [Agaribacter marinus]GLR70422.1 histidine kinase [Agaribacter marinus]